ncbi:MAG: ankyrin repeat domain-containing protein [Chlamydiota bacterium]
MNERKGLVDDSCFIEFAKRWKAYLENSLFKLSQPELFPGAIVFTGGHIETYLGRLTDELTRLGVSVPLFIGPKNAGLLGAAWNAVNNGGSIINELGQTELTKAIALQNREAVEFLLKNGSDLNERDALGYTPLAMAIEMEDLQSLELLIEYGAGLNIRSVSGASPLLLAVQKNNCKMVEVLLKKGADSDLPDYWNQLPVILAKKNNNQAM